MNVDCQVEAISLFTEEAMQGIPARTPSRLKKVSLVPMAAPNSEHLYASSIAHAEGLPRSTQEAGSKRVRKIQNANIWQFLRFCVVGTCNAVLDFGVLNLLLWLYPTTAAWKTLGYNTVAVLLAATNSFLCNKYWTFQKRGSITFQEVYRFCVVASGTTLMNDTLMWLLSRAFPGIMGSNLVGSNALKLGAIIGTMSISFFGMRLWVFLQSRYSGTSTPSIMARTVAPV